MKRRAALALALCLTTIVGFFIVGYGMQIGFFGGGSGPGDAAARGDPTAGPHPPPPRRVGFTGEVTPVSGSTFTVDSHAGQFSVTLAEGASVHGELEVGAR